MPVDTPTRVLCVDDHAFLAAGLRSRIEVEPDLEFVGHLATAERLVNGVRERRADVVLLDIEMPGPDPFQAIRDLQRRCPEVRTVILSAYVRDAYFDAAVQAGAWGYLSKSDDPDAIMAGILEVARGEFALSPEVKRRCGLAKAKRRGGGSSDTATASRLNLLTPREQEILRMIGRGMSRTEIAKTLHRSPKTVDTHQCSVMDKLDIHDRVDLVRYAIREGLVDP